VRRIVNVKIWIATISLTGIMVISGCQTLKASPPVEAIIPEHSEGSLEEVTQIISKALSVPVTLTHFVFNKNSRLVIEPKMRQMIQHGVIQGKILEKPPVFVLTLSGSECRVTYQESKQSWILTKSNCIPSQFSE